MIRAATYALTAVAWALLGLSTSHGSPAAQELASSDAAPTVAVAAAASADPERMPTADPDSAELRFRRARELVRAGGYQRALEDYDYLRARWPHDVDYAFGRGQLLALLGRDGDALLELAEASALAPDYEAVWRLRYSIQARQRGPRATAALDELRRAAAERFPSAQWWRAPAVDPASRLTLIAGAGYEALSNGLPDWDNQFVELQWRRSDRETFIARTARDARFNDADLQFGLGGEWRLDDDWFAGGDTSLAADASFVARLGYGGHFGRRLQGGWVLDLRYRRREYETATVGTFIGTAEKYVGDYRAAYSLGVSHLHGAGNTLSHTAHLNWYLNDRTSFGLSLVTGDEAESVAPGQVLETDVRGVSFSGRHRINDRVGLDWWLGHHEQGDFYRRRYVGVAVSVRI